MGYINMYYVIMLSIAIVIVIAIAGTDRPHPR